MSQWFVVPCGLGLLCYVALDVVRLIWRGKRRE